MELKELEDELLKTQKRLISLEDMVTNHYEVLSDLCKDFSGLWTRWYELAGIFFRMFRALKEMDILRDNLYGNDKFLDGKLKELEGVWKGFIKKYYQDGHPHSDKKTNKDTNYIYSSIKVEDADEKPHTD